MAGIFWTTAMLAVLAIGVLSLFVPNPVTVRFHRDTEVELGWLRRVLAHPQLLRLDIGVLILHFVMTATLFTLPLIWVKRHAFPVMHHWWVYLPVMFVSVLVVLPFIILGEKKRQLKQVFIGAVFALGVASPGPVLYWLQSSRGEPALAGGQVCARRP